jgi:serine O-acetyltransferase
MHEPTTLIDLLKSDLERHYYYRGARDHKTRRFDLWKLFVHPRCAPVAWYRLAHTMKDHRVGRVVGKVFTWWVFHWYGLETDARFVIGPGCYIPRPSRILIGASSFGSRVLTYYQETQGARAIRMDLGGRPVIGDDVILGAGAKVLGEDQGRLAFDHRAEQPRARLRAERRDRHGRASAGLSAQSDTPARGQ